MMNPVLLKPVCIPSLLLALILLWIPGMRIGAEEAAEITSIGLMADELWQKIGENPEEMPDLPRMDYLISTGLYAEERLASLGPEVAWGEAHALAAMQSAYLERLTDYTDEFIFVTGLQYRTRAQVVNHEMLSPIDPASSAVPYLMHQLSDELVGICYVYGGTLEVFGVSQRTILSEAIIETTLLFIDEFEPESLQALYYLAVLLPGVETDTRLKHRFEDFVDFLYQKLETE